ncbi:MAG: ATP-binding protein [Thaumarchaeota archaeon]|nr:ATP-binding protein [Nitrososphaerota archaeon]
MAKGTLALSNLEGGGYIIIGVSKNEQINRHEPVGMSESDSRTYEHDVVSQFVNEFAEPHVDIELKYFSDESKYFVVIQVFEFENEPVICKKGTDETIRGRIYCRTHRKVESSPEPSVSEMREIVDLAVDKGMKKQKRRAGSYGFDTEHDPFEQERKDF